MMQKDNPRQVNNLLHTLRGEQFRHSQNLLRSRTHLSSANSDRSTHSLPVRLFDNDYDSTPQLEYPDKKESQMHETVAWREEALSLVLSRLDSSPHKSRVPSLSLLCLRIFLSTCTATEFREEVVPYLPSHIRRDLVRYTAVHSPLSNTKLYPLFQPEGHADGEVIIVGPSATLREEFFLKNQGNGLRSHQGKDEHDKVWEWDSDSPTPTPVSSFLLVSTRLASSTLLKLPPTITHMALINLPAPIPLHRLPGICPLLIVLDISYNSWLCDPSQDVLKTIERVEWTRWSHLRVLGYRQCTIPDRMLQRLNKGRWDDIEVVT